jgi:hypothetical protein
MSWKAVALSPPESSQAGFATPAALIFSLALALVGSALTLQSVHQLLLCKAQLERSRQEYALDGAHLQAVATIVRSAGSGPYAWTLSTDFGWMQILAEPEVDKLSPAAASRLGAASLTGFGVAAPQTLLAGIASADVAAGRTAVADLDPAPLWSACGPSLVSPLGRQDQFIFAPRQPPQAGATPAWRIGEAWRISITTAAGWRDDRIVRFTGDAQRPAAVVMRRLTRGGEQRCDDLLASVPNA